VDALMIQNELPVAVTKKVACLAKEMEVPVIFDPAPSDGQLKQIIDYIDIIMPNQNEATFLTGIQINDEISAAKAASVLLEIGVSTVVIKMGDLGAYYATDNESGFVSSIPAKVVDSVAAGDAFGASFTVSIAEKLPLREAVVKGCAAGSIAVSQKGAQVSMPHRKQVESLISHDDQFPQSF
jgi:ribokinase